jgi:uncharacterized membrane protein YraQ (UPF0718 family)
MELSIALALGGIVGSALRVFITNDQTTFSRKSIGDILVGGAVGVLWPLYPLVELPVGASVLQQASLIGVVSYLAGDVIQNLVQRVGLKLNGGTTPPAK